MPKNDKKSAKKILCERDLPHTTQQIKMPEVKPPKEKAKKDS